MKNKRTSIPGLFAWLLTVIVLLVVTLGANAADLLYTTLPQDTDSALVLANKSATAAASNKFTNIATATTTLVKTGSGIIERIVVNTAGAGSTITIYDSLTATGTKIATATSAAQIALPYGARFATGLTVVTASGTPADITVVYR